MEKENVLMLKDLIIDVVEMVTDYLIDVLAELNRIMEKKNEIN